MASTIWFRRTLFSFSTFGTLKVAMVAMVEGLKPIWVREKGAIDL